jgi:signal transduction histidine kinase/GAF domain-containing protein
MKTFDPPHQQASLLVQPQLDAAAQDESLAARLSAQTQRADDNEALAARLSEVVRSARLLIDADLDGFEAALKLWLGAFAQSTQAVHCTFYDLVQHPQSGQPTLRALSEWVREGVEGSIPVSFNRPDVLDPRGVEDAMARMTSGQVVVTHTCDTTSPMREYLEQQGNVTVIVVPIFLDGAQWGCLGLDYAVRRELSTTDVTVLQTAANTLAAVLKRNQATQAVLKERSQRIAAERARAQDSERLATLMGHVVRSSRSLIDAELSAFESALLAWLGAFGEATDAIRATVYDLVDHKPSGLRTARMLCEWTRPGVAGSVPVSFANPFVVDPRGAEELMAQWTSGQPGLAHTEATAGPMREFLEQQGNATVIAVPIFLDGNQWGCLSFDHAVKRELPEGDIAVLQTAADTLAAVLKRNQAMQTALVERERRIAAQQARAEDSERRTMLLGHVVQGSRALIDAGLSGFEPALHHWLGSFGQATDAIRCTFYDIVDHEPSGLRTVRVLSEWVRQGVEGSTPVSFAQPYVIDPRGSEDTIASLMSGQVAVFHTSDTASPMREFLEQQGNQTVICVPIIVEGKPWGCVSFDHAVRREPGPDDIAVLQTAADTLAAVLHRNSSLRAELAEREARIELQRSRVTELSKANGVMRCSLDALAESQDEDLFVQSTLVELNANAGARTTYLFRCSGTDSMLHLLGSAQGGVFSRDGQEGDPPLFKQGHFLPPLVLQEMMANPGPVWRRFDAATAAQTYRPDILDWHLRMGNAANSKQALMVGKRCVGVVAMVFDHAEPLSAAQEELQCTLCHALALALELARLGYRARRGAEEAAVLGERQRLAREIHDGIAQSFLAIQMQLDTLAETQPVAAPVAQALSLARHGLNEARRAVAALRPQALLDRDLPSAVERLLSQLTMGSSVRPLIEQPAKWHRLPVEVEDHLFRIVQEALNNVMKHAQASSVRVELSQSHDEISVLVADDGRGVDLCALPVGQGFGFESMQQRAQLIGARVEYLSKPSEGMQVLVSLSRRPEQAGNPRNEPA